MARNISLPFMFLNNVKYFQTIFIVPPTWVLKPSDRDVLTGEAVEIPCKVNGKPDAVVQWTLSSNLS